MKMESPVSGMLGKSTVSELICLPFLDTDVTQKVPLADQELVRRGFPIWSIRMLRRFCAIGLWTQIFAWEEWHLDIWDVLFGYSILAAIIGFLIIVFGFAISSNSLWVGGAILMASILVFFCSAIGMRRARI